MKVLLILISCLLVGLTTANTFKPGKLITRGYSRALITVQQACGGPGKAGKRFCNTDDPSSCDGTAVFQCTSAGNGIRVDCTEKIPYCVDFVGGGKAECKKDFNSACPRPVIDFDCLVPGVFPDPANCKKYYVCAPDENGVLVPEVRECDNLYVFDPSALRNSYCRMTSNLFCTTVDCKGKSTSIIMKYQFLPLAKGQVVVTCRGSQKPLVTVCQAGFKADLTRLPVKCVLVCRGPKRAANPDNPTAYFECVFRVQEGWESVERYCPKGKIFSPTSNIPCIVGPSTTTTPPTPTTTRNIFSTEKLPTDPITVGSTDGTPTWPTDDE